MNELDTKLIFSGPVYVDGNTIHFRRRNKILTISAPAKLLKKLCKLLNGKNTEREVLEILSKEYKIDTLKAFLFDLKKQCIIVDSSKYVESQWEWVKNPRFEQSCDLPYSLSNDDKIDPQDIPVPVPSYPFFSALEKRSSSRVFGEYPLTDVQIAGLLHAAYGYTNAKNRTVFSIEELYPLQFNWVQLKKTEKLDVGIYKVVFQAGKNVYFRRIADDLNQFIRGLSHPDITFAAHGIIVIGADFSKLVKKYKNRSVLLCLLEAGHAAQNIQLYASEEGLAAYVYCGFEEDFIQKAFNDLNSMPLMMIPTGNQADGEEDKEVKILFEWVDYRDSAYIPDFYVGKGQIEFGNIKSDICWGRSPDARLAYDITIAEATERLACKMPKNLIEGKASDIENWLLPSLFIRYPNASYNRNNFMLRPFDEQRLYNWVGVTEHETGKKHFVLADLVYYDTQKVCENQYAVASTSGVAAYTDLVGAKERALLELIERHAFMNLWLSGTPGVKINFQSLPSDIQKKIDFLKKMGWDCYVMDMRCKILPSILLILQNLEFGKTIFAAACDYIAERAVDRAFSEAEACIPFENIKEEKLNISPTMLQSPKDHGDLYKNKKYFRKANWMFSTNDTTDLKDLPAVCKSLKDVSARLNQSGHILYSLDMTPYETNIKSSNGSTIFVARMMAQNLIPITFGYGMEPAFYSSPLCFSSPVKNSSRSKMLFPHPFN